MLDYIITIIFIISIAIASGATFIAYELKDKFRFDFLSSLMYMQIFFFTFGIYGLWGQVLIKALMSPYISQELLSRISNILIYMGTPFLVFGWYMLIRFTREISGKSNSSKFLVGFLFLNTLIFLCVGFLINKYPEIKPWVIIKYYYFIFNLVYLVIAAISLIISDNKKSIIKTDHLIRLSIGLLVVVVLENLLIILYDGESVYIALMFIFIFFIGSGFMSIYFRYLVDLKIQPSESEPIISLDEFCNKYEITAREREIIIEIYRGLSNQQIANKLFITLQTVKDHASRIYSKTNTQNRVQLIKILQVSTTL